MRHAGSQCTILALAGGLEIFFLPRDFDYLGDPNCPVRYCKLGEISIETALAGKSPLSYRYRYR
jgi:hypothetical protein